MEHSIIANSGIQLFTFPLEIDLRKNFKRWFHEWYDKEEGVHKLDLVECVNTEEGDTFYYNKKDLINKGYLTAFETCQTVNPTEVREDGLVHPLASNTGEDDYVFDEIFSMSFEDSQCKLSFYENQWIPLPYFRRRVPALQFDFGAFNWARAKFVLKSEKNGKRCYNVLLALDTRMNHHATTLKETLVFPDSFQNELTFQLCTDEMLLMDYCSEATEDCNYINEYLRRLVHPEARSVSKIKGERHKMSYIATYFLLMNYLALEDLMPILKLQKDENVIVKDVDMFIDIGNSRTTALLVEDPQNGDFTKVPLLSLTDFTNAVVDTPDGPRLHRFTEPFDMRLVFRKADFGDFGPRDSHQFVYPSLVRLGKEAENLMHAASEEYSSQSLYTYSSPKRYLWDKDVTKDEWQYLVLEGEKQSHILQLNGITNQLNSNGTVDRDGFGGGKHSYSRSSLMTFAFLEIFSQARMQINSEEYRKFHGEIHTPRRIKRVVVTCPTTMSECERKALVRCANDAVTLLANFEKASMTTELPTKKFDIEVFPSYQHDGRGVWYYDEATCSQMVYLYGEIAHKFKGRSRDFFQLYGHLDESGDHTFILGSLDIGAGTSDLMINEYHIVNDSDSTISPKPLFYDSYYYAGDDMLQELIREIILTGDDSALVKKMGTNSGAQQKVKDFFGHNYNGQSISQRILRKNFNMQVLMPLACHYLELLKNQSHDSVVHYEDVFRDSEPNHLVLKGFRDFFGFDFKDLEWHYSNDDVYRVVAKCFDSLAKKISAIMYTYHCDIIVLSGRPATLPPLHDLFMKYYAVAPNRLIQLSSYYIGDWYPFGNNTGYIRNPKTVVAVGAMIGFYSSDLIQFSNFRFDKTPLNNLPSTINYVETPESMMFDTQYCLTPVMNRGEITAKQLPLSLKIRQENFDSYPSRPLYVIDYNFGMIRKRIRRLMEDVNPNMPEESLANLVNEEINRLKRLLPYRIVLSREVDHREEIMIEQVFDNKGNEIQSQNIRLSIQSLGASECYWLDSGVFDF